MSDSTSSRAPKANKGTKPYRAPKVKAYGNVHDITGGHGALGPKDSTSGAKPNKTLA